MFKKRYFSTSHNFKTGLLCKLFIILGIILLAFSIFFVVVSLVLDDSAAGFSGQLYDASVSTMPESLLSLAIISIAIGVIMYFFYCQFAKLEQIADEIEKGEGFK